jgi:hypothetical protein
MEDLIGDAELKDNHFVPIFCRKHQKEGYKNFASNQDKKKDQPKKKTTKNLITVNEGTGLDDIL